MLPDLVRETSKHEAQDSSSTTTLISMRRAMTTRKQILEEHLEQFRISREGVIMFSEEDLVFRMHTEQAIMSLGQEISREDNLRG